MFGGSGFVETKEDENETFVDIHAIFERLCRNNSLEKLEKNGSSLYLFPLSRTQRRDLDRLIFDHVYKLKMEKRQKSLPRMVPTASTVKKYFDKDVAANYVVLTNKIEAMGEELNYVEPFPLSNKGRIKNIVEKLEDFLEN